jgi:hypothetical protein
MNVFRIAVLGGDGFGGLLRVGMGEGRMHVTGSAGEFAGRLIGSARCLRNCMGNDKKKFGGGNVDWHDWNAEKRDGNLNCRRGVREG